MSGVAVDMRTRKPIATQPTPEQGETALRRSQRATAARPRKDPTGGRMPSGAEQAAMAQQIGARLREAREMQGMSQTRAALLLGYQNSSRLAKLEAGIDCGKPSRQIPLWLLRKASMIYQVSLDYLFGTTETMEPSNDEERNQVQQEMILLMREEWERQRWRDMLVVRAMQERVDAIERMIVMMTEQAEQAEEAMARMQELNPELWEELAGGARLERTVRATAASVRTAAERLARLHREAKTAAGGAQLALELNYG